MTEIKPASILILLLALIFPSRGAAEVQTIHVYVALCDNANQGIIPVPAFLGNGEDPKSNLYWGAMYGVKSFFKKSSAWKLFSTIVEPTEEILERCVFIHKDGDAVLVADAYRGDKIKQTILDFLSSAAGRNKDNIKVTINNENKDIDFGGEAQLTAYVGHNGLMDFSLDSYPTTSDAKSRDVIILACHSRSYFTKAVKSAGANPLVWTTGLMAPEAYTLKSAVDGWLLSETSEEIRERAAQAYSHYQKCSLKAAKRLLVTGYGN